MLNYLWAGMMLIGIVWGAFHGTLGTVTEGVLNSAKEAVTLSITMLGIMSFWCGILKIGEESSLRLHLDTDDANAFGLKNNDEVEVLKIKER